MASENNWWECGRMKLCLCLLLASPCTRRSPALPCCGAASKAAAADATAAAALKLDPEDDPIWRDIEEYSKELELPATPPTE